MEPDPVRPGHLRLSLIILGLTLAVLAIPRQALAHPHVFVDTQSEILHDASGNVAGFRHVWIFDELYSTFALQGLDANRDGLYSRDELAELTKVNVQNLGDMGYFTVMRHDRRFVSFDTVQDAFSEVKDNRLVLTFTVPLKTPFKAAGRPLLFQIFDPAFFVAFMPIEGEAVKLVAAPTGCALDFQPPRRNDARTMNLSESFFQALSGTANFGEQFAGRYTVNCR